VSALDAQGDVNTPAGSRHGRKLRFKNKGLPGNAPGHFYVVLQVVLPPADSPAAERSYQNMAQDLAFDPRAELGV